MAIKRNKSELKVKEAELMKQKVASEREYKKITFK